LHTIRTCNSNEASEHIIIQELILYLGMLIKSNPELFTDMNTVRVGHILQLYYRQTETRIRLQFFDQAFIEILSLSPYHFVHKGKGNPGRL